MASKRETGIAVSLTLVIAACTTEGADGQGGGGGDDDDDSIGNTPAQIEGAWYAGRGGTTAPYDPATGSWGTPSGSGLVYVFEAGGTYTKAFQSYESSGGCTTGFTAFERGTLYADGAVITTSPHEGRLVYRATCAPELDSDDPITDLADETFDWALRPNEYDPASTDLYLRRTDGAEATFIRL